MKPMMSDDDRLAPRGLALLRVALALLIAAHGWDRLLRGGVGALGMELQAWGLPMGWVLAWAVTLFEALGTMAYAWGVGVFGLSLAYAGVYVAAVVIHHAPHGWFASGADENGCEYAVFLVLAFLVQAIARLPSRHGGAWAGLLMRVTLAGLVSIHGWHRAWTGDWIDFGEGLEQAHYPMGFWLAGAITALEAVGAPVFAMGRLRVPLGLLFAALYLAAIPLHHWKSGWFMADKGQDGAEYAALLVLGFLCVAAAALPRWRLPLFRAAGLRADPAGPGASSGS